MDVTTISPSSLLERRQAGESINLIDVRAPAEFREVHVEFARNVPLDKLDLDSLRMPGKGPSNDPVYFICQSGGRARKACETLLATGFTNVVNVEGGTNACETAGLPVVRGKPMPVSLERQVRIAAGSLVVLGVLLGWLLHPALAVVALFIGGGLVFSGITDTCGMGHVLMRMPWNRG